MTGANAGAFVEKNTCGARLAAGASCKVKVAFWPTAAGSVGAAVTLIDDANGSPQTIALGGTGQ